MAQLAMRSVCKAMERIAPLRLAEKWDNVGLLIDGARLRIANPKANANRVLLTIDLTPSVLEEAESTSAGLIVSYHPPIFKPLSSLTLANPLQASLLRCAAGGISVYSPHTALDSVWGGINDWLASIVLDRKSETGNVKALGAEKLGSDGEKEGAEGRLVALNEPILMDELERRIKSHLNLAYIQVGYSRNGFSSLIRTVAICAGSGGSMLLGKSADVFFTGEMAHVCVPLTLGEIKFESIAISLQHEVLAALATGSHVVLCGHTNTERGYLPTLAEKLRQDLSVNAKDTEIEVVVSQKDQHPLNVV